MKRNSIIAAVAALAVVSCSQESPDVVPPLTPNPAQSSVRPPRLHALPGQAPVAVHTGDVNAAFDQQAAAYANGTVQDVTAAPAVPAMQDVTVPAVQPVQDVTIPAPAQPVQPAQPAAQDVTVPAAQPAVQDVTAAPAPMGGSINYKMKVSNLTQGRIFVEAQDANGTIYPCGFMDGKDAQTRSFTTPMENAAPIKGPITVVLRDPDKEGAPEIRRYKVQPPTTDYSNKTVEISILPGGIYLAGVDGQIYHQSLPADPTPQPEKPLDPTPAPAPAPAAEPAPAAAPAGQ